MRLIEREMRGGNVIRRDVSVYWERSGDLELVHESQAHVEIPE
jgi:hypothetical protein